MREHKLVALFKLFDKNRVKRLDQFLRSPYHVSLEKLEVLGRFILSFFPDFEDEHFTEEEAYKAMYPGKPFDKRDLTRYLSRLFKVVEEFIAIEELRVRPLGQANFIEDYYASLRFDAGFEKKQKANRKLIEEQHNQLSGSFFYGYLSYKTGHNYLIQKAQPKGGRELFLKAVSSLSHYVEIEMLQAATTLLYQHDRKEFSASEVPYLSSVLKEIEKKPADFPLLVKLWYQAYRLVEEPSSREAFGNLKNMLNLQAQHLAPVDARNFTVLLGWGLKHWQGISRQEYLQELFDIYLIELREKWLLSNQHIYYTDYNNIVTVGLALGHYDWTASFIEDYEKYLLKEVHEDIYSFNKARLLFARKRYTETLKLLRTTNYLDVHITLMVKRLQIKCFFELGEMGQLVHAENTFRVFIHRMDSRFEAAKDANLNFLKLVKLLYTLPEKSDPKKYQKKAEGLISEYPLTPELEWVEKVLAKRELGR